MNKIKRVNTIEELKKLFDFLSEVFYDESIEYNEHYFTMSERYEEMKQQFKINKEFLMYIEDKGKIVAGITGKGIKEDKITIGVLAVDKNYRRKGLATKLISEFENACKKNKIKHIDLGARFRACPLYQSLNYKFSLMIQVFDFMNIDKVRKNNKYNFEEGFSYQGDTYGFIFYKVPDIKKEYIDYFEKNIKTAHVQYIFEKDLN